MFPTRETIILDLVLCDSDQLICDMSPSPPIGHSDHCVVDFSFLVRDCRDDVEEDTHPTTGVKYKWHMGDFEAVNTYLSQVPWEAVLYNNPSAAASWSAFLDVLWSVTDMFVPRCNSSWRCIYRKRYPREVAKLIAKKTGFMEKAYTPAR